MKTYIKTTMAVFLLAITIGRMDAIDTESFMFLDHISSLTAPSGPELFENGIIFTAPSTFNRVGIAFAHEGFGRVHWFQKLVFPDYSGRVPSFTDSGILFFAYTLPQDLRVLEYRMIIDGLWTTDPLNSLYRMDSTGIARSIVNIPEVKRPPSTFDAPPGSLRFSFRGQPGETITVAGTFNAWDPFMYELQETSPGNYSLTLPLPSGTYYYVFFRRGQRILDPNNGSRVYTRDGRMASSAVVP